MARARKERLFTVGYEGSSIDEFVEFLARHGIRRIADLRKNPVSRKKGFSKRRLAEQLEIQGIAYIHLPGLGVPTEWRKKAKNDEITRTEMFEDYVAQILPLQNDDIESLRRLMREKGLALLCYEAEASDCHRRFVADEILRRENGGIDVVDLQPMPSRFSLTKPPRRRKSAAADDEPMP